MSKAKITKAKIHFTKAKIESLPLPEKGWTYYYDLKVQGLGIGVGSTGKRSFILYRKINGIPERITLGRYPDLSIEQARGKASEINSAIAKGANPAQLKRGEKAELTFNDLFEEYLERHSKPNKRTWDEDKAKYDNNLAKPLGKKKLSTINRASIAAIHSAVTKEGYPAKANRIKTLISSIFGWGISVGLCQVNPAAGIRLNREYSRDRFIQRDEFPKFFKALADEQNDAMRDYVLLSLLTGARRSNVLAMQWKDVNLNSGEWYIKETKNRVPQTITLSPEALDVLRNRKPSEPARFVFPGEGKSGHLIEPKRSWKRILERAGIDDLRIHDLRRTLGSWQAKTGASLVTIGKSLNHKSHNATMIYARLDTDTVRQSVNVATAAMMEAGGLKKTAEVVSLRGKR